MADKHEKHRGASTQVSRVINAPRRAVYQAFVDRHLLAAWLAPDNMTGHVHTFEPREGGEFRMSLTYQDPADAPGGMGGKTSEDTDTFQGRFVELAPHEKVVWVTEFESQDPEFAGEMRITTTLKDIGEGTEVTILCEDIPKGIRLEDNELGTKSSLEKLATLFE